MSRPFGFVERAAFLYIKFPAAIDSAPPVPYNIYQFHRH